jgi:hypothetical protein
MKTYPRKVQARWPASSAYARIGKLEKAKAILQDITEANGWSKGDVDIAAAWIAGYEKQPRK